jgi:hypothetical protein
MLAFFPQVRPALPAPAIFLDEFDAGGIRGGFQRRFAPQRRLGSFRKKVRR